MPCPRIAFLTRGGRLTRLAEGGPREFYYGFAELKQAGAPVELLDEATLGLAQLWSQPSEALAARIAGASGIHPRVLLGLLRHDAVLARSDVLVATTHTFGLAAAAAFRLGRLRPKLVTLAMGLMEPEAPAWRVAWLRRLLAGTTLAVLSKLEAKWLRERLSPRVEVRDLAFGVDLEFWTPDPESRRSAEILSVGNDRHRDFATLIAAWRPDFPHLKIVTSQPLSTEKKNISVERGDWRTQVITDTALRARIRRAIAVIVPLHDTLQPSGQSATLQAMACGRPVVLTNNRGIWDRPQLERHRAVLLVPPSDVAAMTAAIERLLADRDEAEAIGGRARRMLEQENVSSAAMSRQIAAICAEVVATR